MSIKINHVLIERVNYLIELANRSLATKFTTEDTFYIHHWVSHESFHEFQSATLSFILNIYGENNPYYIQFKQSIVKNKQEQVLAGRGIINSIKTEIEKGWLESLKGLIASEIFSDFLEMSQHLLDENYKDPAAVMIGGVLEEHLRQISLKNGIPIYEIKSDKSIPKKADLINSELGSLNIYNKLDQKSVTAWLDLRNKAAHGKYLDYTKEQVNLMFQGVTNFIARNVV